MGHALSSLFPLAILTSAILAGCIGSSTPTAGTRSGGPPGSADNPLFLSCGDQSVVVPPVPFRAGPADLVIGPLVIASGKVLASMTPGKYGYTSYGHGDRAYKIGVIMTSSATATVTVAAQARGHVVIDDGLTSVTYQGCAHNPGGFFAQHFDFTHRPFRGCVPLDVTIDNRPRVYRVTISIFAGRCARATSA
jgi:hypothetical protein